MRLLVLVLCLACLSGCTKRKEAPQEPFDARKMFREFHAEMIQLLAVKHQIPPETAEKIAWDYYRKHDAMFGDLLDIESAPNKEKKMKDSLELSEGISQTVSELAVRYGQKESAIGAFLADLRLFERAGQK